MRINRIITTLLLPCLVLVSACGSSSSQRSNETPLPDSDSSGETAGDITVVVTPETDSALTQNDQTSEQTSDAEVPESSGDITNDEKTEPDSPATENDQGSEPTSAAVPETDDTDFEPVANALFQPQSDTELAASLFTTLSGSDLSPVGPLVRLLANQIENTATGIQVLEESIDTESNGTNLSPDTSLILVANYDCPMGGSMQLNRARATDYLIPGKLVDTLEHHTFIECKIELTDETEEALAGVYVLDGEFTYFEDLNFYRRSESTTIKNTYLDFSVKPPDGTTTSTTAEQKESTITDYESGRKSWETTWDVSNFLKSLDDMISVSLSNLIWLQSETFGARRYYEPNKLVLSGSGVITGTLTHGTSVAITMEPEFTRQLYTSDSESYQSFTGMLSAYSSDGSSVIVSAIDDSGAAEPDSRVMVTTHDGVEGSSYEAQLSEFYIPLSIGTSGTWIEF